MKNVISLVLTGCLVYLIVSLSRNIWRLWQAGDRVERAELALESLAREHFELNQQKQKVEGQVFREQEVRDRLHLSKPGEIVLLLPEQIPLVVKPEPTPTAALENWEKWWRRIY